MIYLVHSSQKPLIDKQVSVIIQSILPKPNEFSLVTFDCEESTVQQVVSDAITLPLGEEHKVLVAKNAYFFRTKNSKDIKLDQDFEVLRSYLSAAPDFSTLIFTLTDSKLDEKNEWVKIIRQHGKILALGDYGKNEWPSVIRKIFEKRGVRIDEDALNCFMDRVGRDLIEIIQEADKLSVFSKNIHLKDVEELVPRPLEENVFGIADALLKRDPTTALQIFRDLRLNNEEPVRLLPIIANQLRFFYQVGYLYQNDKMREDEIVSHLKVHPYRVSLALRSLHLFSVHYVLNLLNRLGELDYQIKSGKVDRMQAFELFIVEATASPRREG
jgi:DNA polymerase-3 subunit delta